MNHRGGPLLLTGVTTVTKRADTRLTSGRHSPEHEVGRATDCQGLYSPTRIQSPLTSTTGGL